MNVHSFFGVFMDKRTKIFIAAESLLAERGFYGLSMKSLADLAGVAAGTIYRYFENKDAVIKELRQHISQQMADVVFKGWSDEHSLKEKYNLLWRNGFDDVLNNPQRSVVIEMLFCCPKFNQGHLTTLEEEVFCPLLDFYQQGIDQGYFHNWQIEMLITLSFDSAFSLAKKVVSHHLQMDEQQINQVRDASWLIIQKNNFNR